MKKIFIPLAIVLLFTGCTHGVEVSNTIEKEAPLREIKETDVIAKFVPMRADVLGRPGKTPIQAIEYERVISIFSDETPNLTEIRIEKINSGLKIYVSEDGVLDDSIKKVSHEFNLKRNKDGMWYATDKILTDLECYRGRTADGRGCI